MRENTKETWTSRKWMTQALLHILGFQLGPRIAEDGSQGDRIMWLLLALLLLCFSGCLSLTGPDSVTGTMGGSLRVWCQYESTYKGYNKYWCRGQYDTSCESIVETKGEENVERNGCVSIRDYPEALAFTVTMQNLNEDDAGSYWCKIQTVWILDSWSRDPSALVRVYVSPVTKTPRRTPRPATTPIFLVVNPGRNLSTGEVLTKNSGFRLSSPHFLLVVLLKLPLLLSMLGAVFWVNRPPRAPAGR
ncbi:CMRF35-like molecule 2 [Piliocolobus tephrosceles]|uniref:CMRF35-like molecule 2 n=1 Tax=Piliocolobus tephrosceles TaxID=591936 RepID=UPI000E6B2305|nr:CMRF35-like molecule 2 [Piliocolobus tephrosceles]